MKENLVIFWFRRDLRLQDNVALHAALTRGYKVLPIFIFDQNILEDLPKEDARVTFIFKNIQHLDRELESFSSSLAFYFGKPIQVFQQLLTEHQITKVFTNADYEPYALERDQQVKSLLLKNGISFEALKDQVIFEKHEILKPNGSPYIVFTPYLKAWKQKFHKKMLQEQRITPHMDRFFKTKNSPKLQLQDIGFKASVISIPPYDISEETIEAYEQTRDFPAKNDTSRLGAHLRFGTVSIRQVMEKASASENDTLLKELIWREFFMQILFHFPKTVHESFHKKYDRLNWRNNEEEFELWKQGKTGYPLVDAGMRELNATGFMHNRVRMLVAGFLCKHLLIDWRWGEAYFAENLLDYELASNVGNWQWAAGTGIDAAPYFRIFNPSTQIKKFDKDYEYIKKWVPEFATTSYPSEIVEHKEARERCLKTYKAVV